MPSLQLLDQSVNVIGVPRASSSSREGRCVLTADVIILEWVEASQDESTLTGTHTGHFLDALMRDDELSLVSSQARSLRHCPSDHRGRKATHATLSVTSSVILQFELNL